MRILAFVAAVLVGLGSAAAFAQLTDLLTAPKTLIERAVEARSTSDIAKDNEIVARVNAVMAKLGTVKASTEIYEQRLLITGLFDDKAVYDQFERETRSINGIKKLYWNAAYIASDDAKRKQMMSWDEAVVLNTKAQGRLVGSRGVADVNFRTAADPFGTVFLLGRARSAEEARLALARVKDGNGVRKVVNLVEVRP